MHEIAFAKYFQRFLFAEKWNNMKKCDMLLIALVCSSDNDLRGNTRNISHVIHVVVGVQKRREESKKYTR